VVAFACLLVAVTGPRATAELDTNAFRQLAESTPDGDKTIMGTVDAQDLGTALNRTVGAAQLAAIKAELRQNLGKTRLPLAPAAADWDGLTTPFTGFAYRDVASRTLGGKLELIYRDNFSKNVHVVAGALPAGPPDSGGQANATVQIAVTTATAKRFNLRVGSRVPFGGTVLQVTGIVTPVNQRTAPFWNVDPVAATPSYVQPIPPQHFDPYWQGGAFVSAAQVGAVQDRFVATNTQLIWTFPLALDHLTVTQANRLAKELPAAISTAGQLFVPGTTADVSMSSGALTLVAQFAAQEGAVGSVLNLMAVSLAVVGAAVVLLVAWLMAEKRREEFAVLRARGASRRQLAGAAFAGVALAVVITPGVQPPLSWWLAGLIIVVALAGPVVITVRMHRGYAAVTRPDQSPARMSSLRRLVAEAALALGSAGGLIALRHQGAGAQGGDLYASAAPILAAVPVAIVILRLYPLPP
jgi:putative ABC transport system permease protein